MMRYQRMRHCFVAEMPENIEPGVLYVSIEYGTAIHVCCCGCGEKVVTPLTPTDWKIIYDGENVSLHPSIGNWTLPCRSHYVIWDGNVIEAEPWTDRRIEAARQRSHQAKARYYANQAAPQSPLPPPNSADKVLEGPGSLWQRLNKKI